MGFSDNFFTMAISAILIQNFVLSRLLVMSYLGVSKKWIMLSGMGMAVIFVMTMASAFCYLIYQYILVPFELEYLQTWLLF